jgi:hypothetical protein
VRYGKTAEHADFTDIDIQQAVIVDINDGNPGRPATILGNPGGRGYIFEMEIAGIEIKFVIALVGREEQVDAAVIIKVSRADAGAGVKLQVIEKN